MTKVQFNESRYELVHDVPYIMSQWRVVGSQQEKILQAIGRAWTYPVNQHKVMDESIAISAYLEVCKALGLEP